MVDAKALATALLKNYPDLLARLDRLGHDGSDLPRFLSRLPGEAERVHEVMKAIYMDFVDRFTAAATDLDCTMAAQMAQINAWSFGVWCAQQGLAGFPQPTPAPYGKSLLTGARPADDTPHTVVPGTCDMKADCPMRLRGCGCPMPKSVLHPAWCLRCTEGYQPTPMLMTAFTLRDHRCERCGAITDCALVRLDRDFSQHATDCRLRYGFNRCNCGLEANP